MPRTLLRLATAGSVDDGKSTLLGRLLHDLGALSTDTLEAVERASARRGDRDVNLALVTDGLRAEREQGITIDVAYRFFATERRSFVLADTPGHEQYTRNMVTGASTADVAVVLVDARAGLVAQSRRHLAIAALLGVPTVVVAVNKCDLVGWDEAVFRSVAADAQAFAAGLPWPTEVMAVPISALLGDNVVEPSPNLAWFDGPALLPLLESIEPVDGGGGAGGRDGSARLAVQWVIPPDAAAGREARLVAGRVEGGPLSVGQPVVVQPSGRRTTIAAIDLFGTPLPQAQAGQAVSVELADDVDTGRGELIVADDAAAPTVTDAVDVDVCWMGERPVHAGDRVLVKHTTRTVRAVVESVGGRLDVAAGAVQLAADRLELNDIGRLTLRLAGPIAVDPFRIGSSTGRLTIIDEASNATVGAAMVRRPTGEAETTPDAVLNGTVPVGTVPIGTVPDGTVPAGTDGTALSAVEHVKASSRNLRGALLAELDDGSDRFSAESTHLVKFHGFYQQDDRDVRRARAAKKLPLLHSYMVRAAVPGGALRAEQWLAMDSLAVEVARLAPRSSEAEPSLRITTRQGVQYHFVAKASLRQLIGGLNAKLVTTLAACGDVSRNVMACPAPHAHRHGVDLFGLAGPLAAHVRPKTPAYYELWIDGDKAATAVDERPGPVPTVEPLYGDSYLPRKFKIAVAWPGDNCVDLFSHDLGLVPTFSGGGGGGGGRGDGAPGEIEGYTLFAGGGMGQSHAREGDTYPRLATPFGWAPADAVPLVAEAVIGTFRDFGDRADRGRARLKYLIDDRGEAWFRDQVAGRLRERDVELEAARPIPAWTGDDEHLGWHEQADGRWFCGVHVDSGRVVDRADGPATRRAIAALAASGLVEGVRLTPRQDLLLTGIATDRRAEVDEVLDAHRVPRPAALGPVRRLAVACPALPTCGQALGEAERVLPQLVSAAEAALDAARVTDQEVRIHVTGCPNGCARPYTAEIGIVGRTKHTYDVYVGGAVGGSRLARRLATDVHLDRMPELFTQLFARYGAQRIDGEAVGDFCERVGLGSLADTVPVPAPRRRRLAS